MHLTPFRHGTRHNTTLSKRYISTNDVRLKGQSNILSNQREFFDQVSKSLHINQPNDWHKISVDQIYKLGGSFVQTQYNGSLISGTSTIVCDPKFQRYKGIPFGK
jgi:hypothetical protein